MPLEDWILPSTSERIAKRIDELVAPRAWLGLIAIIVAFGLGFAALILIFVSSSIDRQPMQPELAKQLQELDRVKDSLAHLSAFIEVQRGMVKNEAATIEALRQEHTKLEPISGHERDAAEYFLSITAQRAQRDRWIDLSIGTIFGIFSHFLASVFFQVIRRWSGKHDQTSH